MCEDPNRSSFCLQPPPRQPLHAAQARENDEEKQFRRVFEQLAGDVSSCLSVSVVSSC